NEWKIDSIGKDSLKLEIWKQLAHVYVHKRDGIKVITYLLPLQDYAMKERDLLLKEQALDGLTGMYDEWTGKSTRAIAWGVRIYKKLAGDSTAKNDQNFKSLHASYYLDTKQYNLAIPAFKELKEEAEKEGSLSTTRWLCKLLADAYAASHDYKNAHAFLEQAYKLKDSLEKL